MSSFDSSFKASDEYNIYALSDQMKERGWNLNALQFPSSVHLCVTMLHTQEGVAERFVKDVREISEMILANPEKHKGGSVAIYGNNELLITNEGHVSHNPMKISGMAQSLPDRSLVDQMTWIYLDALYATPEKSKAKPVMNGKKKKK